MGDAKMTSPSGSFTTYTAAAAYSEATKAAAAAVAEVAKERDSARSGATLAYGRLLELLDVLRERTDALDRVVKERDEALAKYAFMVERAADTKLDGYRELASKLEQSEARVAELEALLSTVHEHLYFSEPEFCDGRLSWVPVQMDRQDYSALRAVHHKIKAAIAPQEKKEVPRG